ncbi:hypothetical protein, partial [Pseudomonas aeruginosa]|uniref:hypothetical protein n=1 Tax=Pseudomonas aeruginosa TaxID=287 RepID=UPI0031B7ABD5
CAKQRRSVRALGTSAFPVPGGHGIDITGDSATVDNKGGMTVTDPDSIGILIDGDKAIVNNDGDNAISNGGTGTQINGDDATANNNGKTIVDGKD